MTDKSPDEKRAKIFWNGRSQAVRLPREFRFEGEEVLIRRAGDAVILEPVGKRKWPRGYWSWLEKHREELELGEVEPLRMSLQDPDADELG
jgi:antitoxin VapB